MWGHYYPRYPQFCVSLRRLHERIDSFHVPRDEFVYRKLKSQNLPYSP
jgi:hypothetical protein